MALSRTILVSVFGILLLNAVPLRAEQEGPQSSPTRPVEPPQLPVIKPPVEFFRELLAMTPGERKRALASRSEETQKRTLEKLKEYEDMPADDRELRLQATELRWYLAPLMAVAPSNRVESLKNVPDTMRPLVESRLQAWDKLPVSIQKALLDNRVAITYFTESSRTSPGTQNQSFSSMSPQARERIEKELARWHQLPEKERQQLLERFNEFFDLTTPEKQKALATLSDSERRQLERTLKTFGNLTPQQRAKCIQGFTQFASMNPEERQLFFRNAERWKAMPPEQRQAWRDLVAKLNAPPLPSDYALPPMPPRNPKNPRTSGAPALTNVTQPGHGPTPGS
jgi:hypothetical protein